MSERVVTFEPGTSATALNSGEMQKLISLEEAEELFDGYFIGPKQVSSALSIEIDTKNVPPIPFTRAEFERAHKLEYRLILRVPQTLEGTPLTMNYLTEHLQPKMDKRPRWRGPETIWFSGDTNWCKEEPFFTTETPRPGWALVSDVIEGKDAGSQGKNYIDQTKFIVDYLKKRLYKGMELPSKYKYAINEFNARRKNLYTATKYLSECDDIFIEGDTARHLSRLTINKLCRQTAVEAMYDHFTLFFNNEDTRLFYMSGHTWTITQPEFGEYATKILSLGGFTDEGMILNKLSITEDNYDGKGTIGLCLAIR